MGRVTTLLSLVIAACVLSQQTIAKPYAGPDGQIQRAKRDLEDTDASVGDALYDSPTIAKRDEIEIPKQQAAVPDAVAATNTASDDASAESATASAPEKAAAVDENADKRSKAPKAADSSKKAAEKPSATKSDVPEGESEEIKESADEVNSEKLRQDHSIGNYLNGAVGPESDNPQMVAENPDAGNVDSSPQVGVPQEEHDGPPQQEDASNQPPPAGESGPGDDL